MISVGSFWMKTFQSSMLAEFEWVHVITGRVDGSGTCVLKSQAISPSTGSALLAATVGIVAVPSVQVRLSQGRCVARPSVLVNVISASEASLVINAIERYESPLAIAACTSSVTSQSIQSAEAEALRSLSEPTSVPMPRAPSTDQLLVPS